ncbi:RNA polymerase sigma-54 factor [Qipengyuania flava]|jgi:RNA polymerase sigma-54 factor|uniref:RNA polymerase sigma-54 factor n=1 Tax=Qipengyuania flava TaxID=192812 RepID=A0A5P6N837_9SPHN|nr:RNA polymerase factor sigma-54 [Qipengyuania flava]MBW3169714.1 RNA polymerase factor sigma-54 [Qipengyuania flava]MBY5966952.1 RNA polymerase factor sigma-54 [Qipengyuania flava]MBY6013276.1 RNA polymerase factor sigma-54 [Qipengyuania flava]MBY6027718.1 RNA polymerase factor sigma-54 [Qipengyuania flava]QFI62175.1 RNA polymerase sigma-54 factor [Qipengyuania flava]
MALGPRLDLRQTQSLVMTPQLQQAIKLLALSNLEIETFVGEALESNPLLEMGEVRREAGEDAPAEPQEHDSAPDMDGDSALDIADHALDPEAAPGDMGDWSRGDIGSAGSAELPDLENRSSSGPTLADHLTEQVGAVAHDTREALIALRIIGDLDEAGYLPTGLLVIAEELGVPLAEVERALATVQSLDPTGVGARSLSECLALQAREADRYDPCMARLIDNLDLVASGDIARLKRMCEVDDEDFADMLAELRGYDPKPGLAFGGGAEGAVVPDVLITPSDAGWDIRLNEASLPRLVVNREYYLELKTGARDKASQSWLNEQLGEADWLIRALDQRQKTILKTAAEIVKRQEGFFREGVTAMRPLTLREVAEQIEMHESTVSRVTSNKYLSCPRGTFELKYFFSSGVAAADGEGASSEAIKARIKALCDGEDPKKVLSDQKLADLLNAEGFDLARRTVAKYREAIGIGSSAQRRRQKKLAAI